VRRICIIENCGKVNYAYGYCVMHDARKRKYGDPLKAREYLEGGGKGICSIRDCDKKVRAKFFCIKHLNRFTKYGNPFRLKKMPNGAGHIRKIGYKMITVNGKQVMEHRHFIEVSLGRKLNSNEDVHHINGDKRDNHIDNLLVLTKPEHTKLHILLKKNIP